MEEKSVSANEIIEKEASNLAGELWVARTSIRPNETDNQKVERLSGQSPQERLVRYAIGAALMSNEEAHNARNLEAGSTIPEHDRLRQEGAHAAAVELTKEAYLIIAQDPLNAEQLKEIFRMNLYALQATAKKANLYQVVSQAEKIFQERLKEQPQRII